LHTVAQRRLIRRVCAVDDDLLDDICGAVAVAGMPRIPRQLTCAKSFADR
jgi:hypothetical protein